MALPPSIHICICICYALEIRYSAYTAVMFKLIGNFHAVKFDDATLKPYKFFSIGGTFRLESQFSELFLLAQFTRIVDI